jgi:hypothetical protein
MVSQNQADRDLLPIFFGLVRSNRCVLHTGAMCVGEHRKLGLHPAPVSGRFRRGVACGSVGQEHHGLVYMAAVTDPPPTHPRAGASLPHAASPGTS